MKERGDGKLYLSQLFDDLEHPNNFILDDDDLYDPGEDEDPWWARRLTEQDWNEIARNQT
jgi:hypothetical protein